MAAAAWGQRAATCRRPAAMVAVRWRAGAALVRAGSTLVGSGREATTTPMVAQYLARKKEYPGESGGVVTAWKLLW